MSEHGRADLILALSRQQRIGLGVAIVMVVGWLVYIVGTTRRTAEPGSEIELAPNRKPYLDDEGLEGPKLTKALTWGLVLMGFIAVGLPVAWGQPGQLDLRLHRHPIGLVATRGRHLSETANCRRKQIR